MAQKVERLIEDVKVEQQNLRKKRAAVTTRAD